MRFVPNAILSKSVMCSVVVSAVMVSNLRSASPTEPLSLPSTSLNSVQPPLPERFTVEAGSDETLPAFDETPDFQKHISPLLGRLGCNGRACHGSFQGQGGFQLSLFGYDFAADYKALLEADRVDLDDRRESLILTKPVDADIHDGGMRYEEGSWQYWVLRSWVEAGAPFQRKQVHRLERLEVVPSEIVFREAAEQINLKAIAHWEDGTKEDVTCLCRFQSNDSAVADIDENGAVRSAAAGDTHVVVSYDNAVVPVAVLRPMNSDWVADYPQVAAHTEVDRLIVQKLRKLGVVPSELCSDEEFLRRASLDVTGTLPSPDEIREFVEDVSAGKRAAKIEELLDRPGYAARWTTFLCDITGNNEDQLRNFLPRPANMSNQWYQWIYARLEDNVPYDQIVEGIVTATSRLPGESYREYCESMSDVCRDTSGESFAERPGLVHYWARRNFQTAEERAIGFAYSFLGVRIQCAQCHKHPFDQWSKQDFDDFEKLFGTVQARQNTIAPDAKKEYQLMVDGLGVDKKLKGNQLRRELTPLLQEGKAVPLPELIVAKPRNAGGRGKAAQPPKARLLGGDWVEMGAEDIRGDIMAWLRSTENPYFSKAIVNRVWKEYFGTGIVDPADDLNLANAPSNQALLDYLATGFVESGYDLMWLHRQILNSDAYQRSWVPNDTNRLDKKNFSHAQLRRLNAEITYDALRMALGDDELANEMRELEEKRALTKAGASARASNDEQGYALQVFGRSVRESNCDCDRSNEPSLLQTVFVSNDASVQSWLADSKSSWVASVAEKYRWPKPDAKLSAAQAKARRQQLERWVQQIERIDERRMQAAESGNQGQLKTLRRSRAETLKRIHAAATKSGLQSELRALLRDRHLQEDDSRESETPSIERMTQEQAMWVAENAYLRTLSRFPNASELDTVINYLRQDSQPTEAVKGLVWSLINTKEFILNH